MEKPLELKKIQEIYASDSLGFTVPTSIESGPFIWKLLKVYYMQYSRLKKDSMDMDYYVTEDVADGTYLYDFMLNDWCSYFQYGICWQIGDIISFCEEDGIWEYISHAYGKKHWEIDVFFSDGYHIYVDQGLEDIIDTIDVKWREYLEVDNENVPWSDIVAEISNEQFYSDANLDSIIAENDISFESVDCLLERLKTSLEYGEEETEREQFIFICSEWLAKYYNWRATYNVVPTSDDLLFFEVIEECRNSLSGIFKCIDDYMVHENGMERYYFVFECGTNQDLIFLLGELPVAALLFPEIIDSSIYHLNARYHFMEDEDYA